MICWLVSGFDLGFGLVLVFCLSATLGGLWFGAGIRVMPFRWHPRFALPASGVAPVRGGTYFSLPPQRKVGKRKRLTPPALVLA
ncbi:hypothetical protein [Paraburkholderia caribensis]|uniref:hypothetical protein n=1 Tax=Paraburkholderia caribensis TaxID=75105 RepID=UPI0011DF8AAA|nr:hypothetical protein [Paraburkholderia caribensis]